MTEGRKTFDNKVLPIAGLDVFYWTSAPHRSRRITLLLLIKRTRHFLMGLRQRYLAKKVKGLETRFYVQ
jgi:hypothetical protein